jgi:hypothetical protein
VDQYFHEKVEEHGKSQTKAEEQDPKQQQHENVRRP